MELTDDDRRRLTLAVMELLEGWGLQPRDMVAVLNLPEAIKARSLGKYRDGTATLPDEPAVLSRMHFLLRISDALGTYFPTSAPMRKRWMRQANRRFRGRAPIAVIAEEGEAGLMTVLAELDCTYAWDLSGSHA